MIRSIFFSLLLISSLLAAPLSAQDRLKVMQYNLLLFGDCDGVSISQKYDWLSTILEEERPDILAVNELSPQQGYVNGIKALSFAYTQNVGSAALTNDANSNIVNMLFYNEDKLALIPGASTVIPYSLRDINTYRLYYLPTVANGSTDTLYITVVVGHFKAGQSSSDQASRQTAATLVMNYVASLPAEEAVLVMGDFNLYNHQEQAYQTLTNGADPATRLIDVTGLNNGWLGPANAIHATQSTRTSSPDCGSGGGMDDRFDFILASQALINPSADLRIDSASYRAVGNDGNSYNSELSCAGNNSVSFGTCLALKQMSDHLPVAVELVVDGSVAISDATMALPLQLRTEQPGQQWEVLLPHTDRWQLQLISTTGQRWQWEHQGDRWRLRAAELPAGWYVLMATDASGRQGILRLQVR